MTSNDGRPFNDADHNAITTPETERPPSDSKRRRIDNFALAKAIEQNENLFRQRAKRLVAISENVRSYSQWKRQLELLNAIFDRINELSVIDPDEKKLRDPAILQVNQGD